MTLPRRLTGVALLAALLLSVGAQALAAWTPDAGPMACCADGERDACGMLLVAAECCGGGSAEAAPPSLLPAATAPVVLARRAIAVLSTVEPRFFDAQIQTTVVADASPPPTYVLLATFLI